MLACAGSERDSLGHRCVSTAVDLDFDGEKMLIRVVHGSADDSIVVVQPSQSVRVGGIGRREMG